MCDVIFSYRCVYFGHQQSYVLLPVTHPARPCLGPFNQLHLSPFSLAAIHRNSPRPVKVPRCHSDPPNPHLIIPTPEGFRYSVLLWSLRGGVSSACMLTLWKLLGACSDNEVLLCVQTPLKALICSALVAKEKDAQIYSKLCLSR